MESETKDDEEEEEEEEAAVMEQHELTPEEIKAQKESDRRTRITELKNFNFNLEGNLREEFEKMVTIKEEYDEPLEELTQEELDAWVTRYLIPDDPNGDANIVQYSFCQRSYIPLVKNTSELIFYHMEGNCVHVETNEAIQQQEKQRLEAFWEKRWGEMDLKTADKLKESMLGKKKEESEETESSERERDISRRITLAMVLGPEAMSMSMTILPQKKLRNPFNFSDREAQTYATYSLDNSTQTIPVPTATLNGLVNQGIIFDEYKRDFEEQEAAKERERLAKMIVTRTKEDRTIKKAMKSEDPIFKRIFEGLRILERMLNQNTYDYIAMDCQFYEDPSDKYRTDPIQGTLLPLWQFKYNDAKNVTVTDLNWNPAYYDLFGATFGSFDFCDPCPFGYLCVFTLKNPSFPEYVKHFNTGAMCLDFHPRKCFFVAVGLLNGGVVVLNIMNPTHDTPYKSTIAMNHTNLVWKVLWCDDARERHLCFFSAGADGRICKWMLLETELYHSPVITLYLDKREPPVDSLPFKIRAMPTCMMFHPKNFEIFYVGAAVGRLFKCNISYASTYLYYIEAHRAPIHQISFNCYNSDIFATCSEDWRVKIWEDDRPEPLFSFDLDDPVLDVKWAPYSSTVFAAYVSIGKIYVYDLSIDKYLPLCKQTVICADDNVGTRISFNQKIPIIIVGDTRGNITSLKFSPNLRIMYKAKTTEEVIDLNEYERKKLDNILAYVREPIFMEDAPDKRYKMKSKDKKKDSKKKKKKK